MTSTPALAGVSRSSSSGCTIDPVCLATSSIAAVSRSAYGRASMTRCCALTIRDAAMSSMARVIFAVDCTDRIRRRTMRSWAPTLAR